MIPNRRFSLLTLTLFIAVCAAPAFGGGVADEGRRSDDLSTFSEAAFLEHVGVLADDTYEGRGTGQEGIDKAAEYIAGAFEEWGVQPGGDDHTYFQNFTLKLKSRVAQGTRLAVSTDGRPTRRAAKLNEDYVPFPFSANGSFRGEVVFAGYGIVKDDAGYNDYAGIEVADKIVLVLRRGPKFGEFSMQDSAFRAKASRAAARDAAAVLVVNPADDEDGDKLFDFDTQGTARFGGGGYGIPMIHISRKLADRLLHAGGLGSVEAMQKRIEDGQKPASAVLEGVTVRGEVNIEPIESPVRNVIGVVPGTGPQKDEYIILGAHYDHLGIRNKGTPEFNPEKDISNGADDNASGTTLVMLMAKAFASGKKPNRTMVFMLFTGEELGLLGSAHYANNPTVDLSKVNAMLNFDMVGRLKDNKLEVGGMRTGGFEERVRRLAESYDLVIRDGGGGRGPSDHTNFYNKEIPVLFFFTGLHKQYHQPEDDTPLLNLEGAVRIARYSADIIDEIDGQSQRIVFAKDTGRARISRQDAPDDEPQAVARAGEEPDRMRLGIVPDMENDEPGVVIAQVADGSPASGAGLQNGDRIVRIGEKRISGVMDIAGALAAFKWGDSAAVQIVRSGQRKTINVKFPERTQVAARPAPDRAAPGRPAPDRDTQDQPRRERRRAAPPEGGPGPSDASASASPGSIEQTLNELIGRMGNMSGGDCTVTIQDEGINISITVAAGSQTDRRLVSQIGRSLDAADKGDVRIGISFDFSRRSQQPQQPLRGPRAGRRGMRSTADSGERDMDNRADRGNRPERPRDAKADPHAHANDDITAVPMPKVRLGIMPTYGEPDGRGYEISGVVDDGPAAKAGMKNDDRILKIGNKKVTDVYSYMEALGGYKPGDEVAVVVLRGDHEIAIKIKSAPQKSLDAD